MATTRGKAIRQQALSELERLAMSLDEAFDITANMSIAELDEELREMGDDPHRLPSASLARILTGKGRTQIPAYAFVSDALLRNDPAPPEAKLLILKVRVLGRQQRYKEGGELAEQATRLAPNYSRAWLNHGSLRCLMGDLDGGEAVFHRMRKEFSANSKAVAAALHGCASVKEVKGALGSAEGDLRDVLREYEEALELDGSRANTRACLVINSLLSRQTDKGLKLFEGSLLCEGFFEAMSLELRERGARDCGVKMYRVMQALPMWFRNLLDSASPGHAADMGVGFAY